MTFHKYALMIIISLVTSMSVFAAPEVKEFTVGDNKQKIKTLVPEGWDALPNVYNTPLSLLSKKGLQDLSTVVQIVPFGVKDSDDGLSKIQKDPESYYSQKEEQVDGQDGDILSYEPFEESKKDGATIYSIGVKYKNAFGEFLDQTYYISTKSKEMFYVKALVPLDLEAQHTPVVSQVINTISSKN